MPILTRTVVVVALTAVVLVAAIGTAAYALRPPIRVLSSKLQIVSVVVTKGTNQAVYFGNQLKGRVQETLSRLRLGIQRPVKCTFGVHNSKNMWIVVVFNGNYTGQELTGIKAELATSAGRVVRLDQGFCQPNRVNKNYMGAWLMDFNDKWLQSGTNTSYKLRLKLPIDSSQLAEIELGTLRR